MNPRLLKQISEPQIDFLFHTFELWGQASFKYLEDLYKWPWGGTSSRKFPLDVLPRLGFMEWEYTLCMYRRQIRDTRWNLEKWKAGSERQRKKEVGRETVGI